MLPCQRTMISCHLPNIMPLLWHNTQGAAIIAIAMPSPLLLYVAFGGIYQDMGLAPTEVFKSQLVT